MSSGAFVLLDGFGDGGELVLVLFVIVVIEVFFDVVFDETGVDFDIKLDHIRSVVGFEWDDKKGFSVGLDGLLEIVLVAVGIGIFEEFPQVLV